MLLDVTIKVLLILLPASHSTKRHITRNGLSSIQIAKKRKQQWQKEKGKKNDITNIKFVCRAIEIADFTAHFGWMRFQSFWMTARALCVRTHFGGILPDSSLPARIHASSATSSPPFDYTLRNGNSNKVHPIFHVFVQLRLACIRFVSTFYWLTERFSAQLKCNFS